MTVEELKEILNDLSDDMEVKIVSDGYTISYIHDWWAEDRALILG